MSELFFNFHENLELSTIKELFIFGESGQEVTVENSNGFNVTTTITGEGFALINIPDSQRMSGTGVNDLGFQITSEEPIQAYFSNRSQFSTDLTIVFEKESLGTEYLLASIGGTNFGTGAGEGGQFSVQATEDNTTVDVTLPDGQTFSVTLNAAQTFKFATNAFNNFADLGISLPNNFDLTGTLIKTSAPTAVFSGHECTQIGGPFCDHIVEQMPPISVLSSSYIVGEAKNVGLGDNLVRVIAAQDNTEVVVDGTVVATLSAQESYDFLVTEDAAIIETSLPTLVTQYLRSDAVAGEGDPAMMFVPGQDAWLSEYRLATPAGSAAFAQNLVNVVIPTSALNSLTINGEAVDTSEFVSVGSSGFSVGNIEIDPGLFSIAALENFQVSLFGFDSFDSYLTFGAAAFASGISPLPPILSDDTFTSNEDTAFTTGNVLNNDTDPNGDPIVITSIDTSDTVGQVIDNGDGTFDYDPNGQFEFLAAGDTTTDTFSYTATDNISGSDTATVTVTIEGVNDAPTAVDDTASTNESTPLLLNEADLLSNDSDIDGDTLTVESVSESVNGTVELDDDIIVFSPNSGFIGDASFNYSINDGNEGIDTATVTVAVNSVVDPDNAIAVSITAPNSTTASDTGIVTVTYRNTGNSDVIAPLLNLIATGANLSPVGDTGFTEESIQFLGINDEGTVGILPAGATNSLSFGFQVTEEAGEQINFSARIANSNETINWEDFREDLKPDYLSDAGWNAIYDNFTASVGSTVEDYQEVLVDNANYLFELGDYVADANRLTRFEFQQASDYQFLAQRYSLGSFGRGRSFIGDIQAVTDEDGNVFIENFGTQRFFERQSDGSYRSQPGDYASLTQQGGTFRLREKDGTVIAFQSNGRLDFIEDKNGNRVRANFTNDRLTSLVGSNDTSFTFNYNDAGRIVEATDQAGVATVYTYDSTNELLLSATDAEGTTSYTYNSDFALTSVTNPEGNQYLYEYDEQGRLIRESITDDAETYLYSYDSTGGITTTNATGATETILLNDQGRVSQFQDALGNVSQLYYDDAGNLIRLVDPNNTTTDYAYDEEGNLISRVNPLGERIEFTYEPTFNGLQSFTDALNNTISYGYSERGNLISITYPDASSENFSYDAQGNVIEIVNRRGQPISYAYNDRYQLIRTVDVDGSTEDYTYDDRSNLTSATDDRGTTTLEYDEADRLVKITYPAGRFLEYIYDAGERRTQMVDQDGNVVNYSYDAAGRLASLTDGEGNLIVAYIYDSVGRPVREDNGNGSYTTYEYDAAGQLLSIVNYAADDSINSRFDYSYDALKRQTGVSTLDGSWTYSYDATDQLTRAVFNSANSDIPDRDLTYVYDAAGNRIRTIENGVTTEYTANNLNQYTSANEITYEYDADGNLVFKTEGDSTWTYTYNSENRLISVTEPDGSQTEYEYDALGNRVATVSKGQRTEFLIDPFGLGDVVGEYDSSGNLIARYTHGLGLESRSDVSGVDAYYDFNITGSTVGLTGADGNYLNSYKYLPFGENFSETEIIANPFEYVGQWGVMEDKDNIYFMRERFYLPSEGRFLNPDPVGIEGGPNLYAYVLNDPINAIDDSGLGKAVIIRLLRRLRPGSTEFVDTGRRLTERQARSKIRSLDRQGLGEDYGFEAPTQRDARKLARSVDPQGQIVKDTYTQDRLDQGFRDHYHPRTRQPKTHIFYNFTAPLTLPYWAEQFFPDNDYVQVGAEILDFFNPLALPQDLLDLWELAQELTTDIFGSESQTPAAPGNQARSKGEPHLTTFDGVGYDFQGAGEFTLVESLDGELDIQIRYIEIDPRATVASAVATIVDGQRVVIDSEGVEFVDGRPIVTRTSGTGVAKVTVDGEVVEIPSGGDIAVGNSRIFRTPGERYSVVYAGEDGVVNDDDDQLVVNYLRPGTINIVDVNLGDEKKGQITGLLGNLNDNPDDDIFLPNGSVLERPLEFDELYGAYRDGWRVQDISESLFDYEPGQDPDTFYNPDFPAIRATFNDLAPEVRARGEAAALAAGYEPGTYPFESAAFDFALTGDPGFLEGLGTDPEVVVSPAIVDEEEPTVITGTPGQNDELVGTDDDDILTGSRGRDTLTGGEGSDQFVYTSIVDAGDVITDFEVGIDQIVLTEVLNSFDYQGSDAIADGYVQFSARGSDSFVQLDPDGFEGSGRARPFILVENVAVSALNNANNFVFV